MQCGGDQLSAMYCSPEQLSEVQCSEVFNPHSIIPVWVPWQLQAGTMVGWDDSTHSNTLVSSPVEKSESKQTL